MVSFEFIIVSRSGRIIDEQEFNHLLLMGSRGQSLSPTARKLLQSDCLKIRTEQRRFVEGRPRRELEVFQVCRRMANIGQIHMASTDHDLITIGRGAHRIRYEGPTAPGLAHLELMVHAAETIRSLRPGIIVDRDARQIWGEHSWLTQLERHHGLGAREHFKIEMSQRRLGTRLGTRGLSKFGLPELRMENLHHDLVGVAAISLTSISLDFVHAEEHLDPRRLLAAPGVRGHFRFVYEPPRRGDEYPTGILTMLGGVDDEEPSELGLLEVLSRLRRRHVDGEVFAHGSVLDSEVYQRAQDTLGRLKEKFVQEHMGDRIFLVRKRPMLDETEEQWYAVGAIEGSTFRAAQATGSGSTTPAERLNAFDQSEICDWMIMRGGDIEDGGFGLKRM